MREKAFAGGKEARSYGPLGFTWDISLALEHAHNAILVVDKTGVIVLANRAASELLGWAGHDLAGRFMGDVAPGFWEDLRKVLVTGEAQIGRKILTGSTTIANNLTPIFKTGQIVGAVSIFQDISEYERMASQLVSYKKLSQELDAIIDSSFDGLWICDGEGRVIRINRASERINGIHASQVLGKTMSEIVAEGLIDRSVTLEVLRSGTTVSMIQRLKDGKEILVTGNPVTDENGEIKLVVVNERDISGLNQLRDQLQETRALAKRYRSELLSMQLREAIRSQLVIRSPCMERVLEAALRVARVDSTVLIRGESGVGKSVFAKLIHRMSCRREGPFIRVDCGAIPESLIESELFGYEGGAFTGARLHGKPGYFELAHGGTLFLDEVGELPKLVQVKLLRFLEDHEVVRVGGARPKKVDVRVIAATHRDLGRMVQEGTFRSDLFFRLNVVPLVIPPLRERTEEIPALVDHFLKLFNARYSTSKVIARTVVDRLCAYPFPGNIRELANLIEQLVVLTPGNKVDLGDLPSHVRDGPHLFHGPRTKDDWNLQRAIENLERHLIREALRAFGSQRKACIHLGVNQSTLARKAKKYGIRVDRV
jgi:PAS domain S-box-containing protein